MPRIFELRQNRRGHIPKTWVACAIAIWGLHGCGGGASGTSDAINTATGASDTGTMDQIARYTNVTTTTSTTTCESAPSLPTVPSTVVNVESFGAIPDDGVDDSVAIQRALDAMKPGQWLVFPPGQYEHNRSLNLRVANVTLWGNGATLNATNPADQALMLKADQDRAFGFTMTATTDYRRGEAWTARLVAYGGEATSGYISGVVMQGNKILPAVTQPGTSRSNSSSSAGILIYATRDFTVTGNTVSRSLADGIHITAGSRNGRVLSNTVSETGDDMIAMVTYLPTNWRTSAQADAAWVSNYLNSTNVKQILVANNNVNGQYWGRGIAVVGGDSITIKNNTVSNATQAAGIMVGREDGYNTTGSSNVVVSNNAISHVQTTAPSYVPTGSFFTSLDATLSSGTTSGHGGIEVHSASLQSDVADARLNPAVLVSRIRLDNNTIADTRKDGVRVGTYSYANSVSGISVTNNRLTGIGLQPVTGQFLDGSLPSLNCSGNTLSGTALTPAICNNPTLPTVSGASLDCTKF